LLCTVAATATTTATDAVAAELDAVYSHMRILVSLILTHTYVHIYARLYPTCPCPCPCSHTGEILALAGCDRLTIAPALLGQLETQVGSVVTRHLEPNQAKAAKAYSGDKLDVGEKSFRYLLNSDAMATEKLAEGIRGFAADIIKLENIVKTKM